MILCCGEALIDMIPMTGTDGQTGFAPLSGGAIFNTSIALGRLEVPVHLLSGISNDLFGAQLVDGLTASNVGTDLLIRSDQPTTLAFVRLTDGQAQYTFYDENSAGATIETTQLPAIPDTISTLYFGGISLCADPAASSYAALCLREASSKVVMMDPNIRTSFIKDESAYRARLNQMMSVADIVKVSDEDLDWIVQTETTEAGQVKILQDLGVNLVIVTKGSEGAFAYTRHAEVIHVPVPKVTVVDTVGAGDTFNAGFVAKLHGLGCLTKDAIATITPDQMQAAMEYAVNVAAVTVSRAGANPPTLAEMPKTL